MLIIRNVLRSPNWRFFFTAVEEWILYLSRWMKKRGRHFPTAEEIAETLTNAKPHVEITPLWGKTPFNRYLIVARHHSF